MNLKNITKIKIKFPSAQKFVGILILFSISLQVLAPLGALAGHHPEHRGGNIGVLTAEQFDPLTKDADGNPLNQSALSIRLRTLRILTLFDFKNSYRNITGQELILTPEQIKQLETSVPEELKKRNEMNAETCYDSAIGNLLTGNINCLVTQGMAWVGYRLLQIVSWLLYLSSAIFNISAQISLDYRSYSAKSATAVYAGWRAARDFMNILFIFIILIIALALILQYQQYYSRQVLVKLVGVALFINFSFFLCQQIINLTNSAALYFKNRITGEGSWELSAMFFKQLEPQQFLTNYKPGLQIGLEKSLQNQGQIDQVNEKLQQKNPGIVAMIIAIFGGIAVMLTASFVLLAAAFMFLIRFAMLWNLIILAPLALTASILPMTQQHFGAWWRRFTREAFFAPAFMFMFYIEMSILNSGALKNFIASNAPNSASTFGQLEASAIFNAYFIVFYILMIMLFMKALLVAKSFSASGVDMVNKSGRNLVKWGRTKPFYAAGRVIRSRVAPVAERITTGEGKISNALEGRIGTYTGIKAGVRAGARRIIRDERVETEARTKRWEGLTNDEKAKELSLMKTTKYTDKFREGDMSGPSIAKLVALVQSLQKTGGLGKVDNKTLKDAHTYLKSRGMDTKDIETYMPSLSKDEKDREKAIQRQQTDKTSEYLKNPDEFNYTENPKNKDLHLKTWGEGHLKEMSKAVDTGDAKTISSATGFLNAYISKYGNGTGDIDKIIEGLEKDNNYSAARFLKTAEGERTIQSMFDKTEISSVTPIIKGTRPLKEKAKEDKERIKEDVEKLENKQAPLDLNASTIAPKTGIKTTDGQERVIEIINASQGDKLEKILLTLQGMSKIEKNELASMLKDQSVNGSTFEIKGKAKDGYEKVIKNSPEVAQDKADLEKAVKNMSDKEVEQFDYQEFKDNLNKLGASAKINENDFTNAMLNAFNPKQVQSLANKRDQMFTNYIDAIKNLAGGSDKASDIEAALKSSSSPKLKAMASWFGGTLAKDQLNLK